MHNWNWLSTTWQNPAGIFRRRERKRQSRSPRRAPLGRGYVEQLEQRTLLSATQLLDLPDATADDISVNTLGTIDAVSIVVVDGRTTYSQLNSPGKLSSPEATARAFLGSFAGTKNLKVGPNDLKLVEVKHGLASTHTRFQQVIDGVRVYGANVSVHQGPDGSVQTVHNRAYDKLSLPVGKTVSISLAEAEQSAQEAAQVVTPYLPTDGELVWYPLNDGTAVLAWQVTVSALDPVGEFLTLVDALTGDVLMQENLVAFATGTGDTFRPNPYQTQGSGAGLSDNGDADSAALAAQVTTVQLNGLDAGTGLLVGEFVDLATLNSPFLVDVDANEATRTYEYTRDDPRFEQVVIYDTIDSIQRYFHSLGFDDDVGIPNGIRDFPTLANAHWDNEDNSFYFIVDDAIHFGDGGVDDGEDGDVIAHEYGHAVQLDQNFFWGGGEMDAMGEGFGDYLAVSFFADEGDPAFQSSHAACLAEWDATSFSGDNPPCLRRVDGNKIYPDDLDGQVHDDGEIWSRALWDIRSSLGGPTTDQLVLEHHFALPAGATMPDAAEAILLADQNINGGANEDAIRQAFVDRGILALPPTLGTVAFDATSFNVGDSLTVTVIDRNAVAPVIVSVDSSGGDTESITLTDQGEATFVGSLPTSAGTPSANGVLEVALGDTLTVTYNDADDGAGNPAVANDSATVVNVTEFPSSDVPVTIEAGPHLSTITITDLDTIVDLDVRLNITHSFDGDLDVFLIAPDGTRVELFTDVGFFGSNFTDTILDDEADVPITDGTAPFQGSFRPEGSLSALDDMSIEGTWTLEITDVFPFDFDSGTLNSWSLLVDLIPSNVTEFPSPDVPITIEAGPHLSTITVPDSATIADVDVRLNIEHTFDADLDVFLIAPNGTRVELFTDVGKDGNDFTDTLLDDEAAEPLTTGTAPFSGSFRPEGSLSVLDGMSVQGTWTLEITDDFPFDKDFGSLNSWSLRVETAPPVITVDALITNDPTPQLTGTVDDPTATIHVEVGGQTGLAAINHGNGTWTLPDGTINSDLADGLYDIVVTAVNSLLNVGTDATTDELTVDTTSPAVAAVVRNGGEQSFDELVTLAFAFSEDVSASLDKLDLVLENTSTQAAVDLAAAVLSYDGSTNTATWDLRGVAIDTGFYRATLSAAGITDAAGNPLDGDADGTGGDDFEEVLLVALPGDTDLDGDIDSTDIQNILGANSFENAAGGPYTWAEGDFNDDDKVDTSDIQAILVTHAFGTGSYAATAPTGASPRLTSPAPAIEFSSPGVSVALVGDGMPNHNLRAAPTALSAPGVSKTLVGNLMVKHNLRVPEPARRWSMRRRAAEVDHVLADLVGDRMHDLAHESLADDHHPFDRIWDMALLAALDDGR